MKKTICILLMSLLLITSQFSLAAKKKPAFYAGIGGGVTSLDTQNGNSEFEFQDDDAGFKIYGGMMLDKFFGVELGYFSLGEYSHDGVSGGDPFDLDIDEFFAVTLSISPVIPIYKRLSLVTRFGIAYWEADFTTKSLGVKDRNSDEDFDLTYGLGPRFTINEHFAIEAGWDRFLISGDPVDLYSLGVRVSTR